MRLPWPNMTNLWPDRAGTVAVEFAFALPVLIMLYFGVGILADAVSCSRKVTITARAVADLASRYSSVTTNDVNSILVGGTQVLSPYDASKAIIVLSNVSVTSSGQATVVWSRSTNSSAALVKGAHVTVPSGLGAVGGTMLMAQVSYAYDSLGAYGNLSLSDTIFMLPRISDEVPLS